MVRALRTAFPLITVLYVIIIPSLLQPLLNTE